ncbi:GNAT family N-acetyltransferase [Streptomyces sp. NPDC006134]|uniref:GNAT family N-acetyltransferase n=1 Tax=Streptomyces sp. NPDC006134 TaxID=3154467 RepID=UPI0033D93B05
METEELVVRYAGAPEGLTYLLPHVKDHFFTEVTETEERRVGSPQALTDPQDADILLSGAPLEQIRALPADRSVVAPFRIHMICDVRGGAEEAFNRVAAKERRNIRRCLRQQGYTYTFATGDDAFIAFYDEMYLPTMDVRHSKQARTVERERALHDIFRRGLLMLVSDRDGTAVGGAACRVDRDARTLHVRLMGVRGGDVGLLKLGVVRATYGFLIQWAAENDFDWMDLQGCEPFLTKGTMQSKSLLGARAVIPDIPLGRLALRLQPVRDTPAVRTSLVRNPLLIHGEDGASVGVGYFQDATRSPRTDLPHPKLGVEFVRHLDLDELFTPGT